MKSPNPTDHLSMIPVIPETKIPCLLLGLGIALPTVITWIYFDLLENANPWLQKSAYAIGKGAQLGLLAIIWFTWLHPRRSHEDSTGKIYHARSYWYGVWIGSGMSLLIAGAYYFLFLPSGWMESVRQVAHDKLNGLASDSYVALIALTLFYSFVHSAFEEFYWRGFIYRGILSYSTNYVAILLSSFAFMAHHVIVLKSYFGWNAIGTYLGSLSVAIGGIIWCWLFQKSQSLIPGWISHAFVDATIFGIGFHLLFALQR